MRGILAAAGLVVLAAVVFRVLLYLAAPPYPREHDPVSIQLALGQTAHALGGLVAFVAACVLLRQAAGSPAVSHVLSLMLALMGGVLLMSPGPTAAAVFGALGLVYAGHGLLAFWLAGRRSRAGDGHAEPGAAADRGGM